MNSWPVQSLLLDVKPLLHPQDLDKFQDKILEETEPFPKQCHTTTSLLIAGERGTAR